MDTVQNNHAEGRYELTVDGHLAVACYNLSDGAITFTHTEVPKELGGRGIGSQLVKGALDDVRARHLRIVAQRPFVTSYIGKHPDYSDLLK